MTGEKNALIARLKSALDLVYQISAKQEEILVIQNRIEQLGEEVKSASKSSISDEARLGIIVALTIGLTFVFCGIFAAIFGSGNLLIFIISLVIALILSTVIVYGRQVSREMKAEDAQKAQEPALRGELAKKAAELRRIADPEAVRQIQSVIPAVYATVDALTFFLTALNNMRADTLKEAINLYEAEKHNREMREMQQQELALLNQSIELGQKQAELQQQTLAAQQTIIRNQRAQLRHTDHVSRQVRFTNALMIINTVRHWDG